MKAFAQLFLLIPVIFSLAFPFIGFILFFILEALSPVIVFGFIYLVCPVLGLLCLTISKRSWKLTGLVIVVALIIILLILYLNFKKYF